eukprot:TRINITY_DN4257_c0_g1_i2.p1 TRINITY_DN4257_c0_g1~~TRINITY_DN4257_c0_g1_i2.p1  ORF type:complete len:669 (-),score=147.97 TRINITY_DN4257_c0_g1_i2:81-2087(-)
MAEGDKKKAKAINVNIGVLGHIDSGKTSLCRVLSTITSTASLDKAPASQERGITLDLGFSSFTADPPPHFQAEGYDELQFCLVDCPGHASLIRTVIGGAQIIDLCMLVIDANKGIQAQTAECLVVAEILANQLVIVLNKIDMIQEAKRDKMLKAITKMLRQTFAATKFGTDLPFAYVSANPSGGDAPIGVQGLVEVLKSKLTVPKRDPTGPFMFSFDHAFPIKGQGTVMTGTVLSGTVKPSQIVNVPACGEAGKAKKIRSLQKFKQPVQEASQGDRIAMCIAALDAKELERGIVLGEKFPVPTLDACVCVVSRLQYFKAEVKTKAKFHVTLGHQTVMATAHFFCPLDHSTPSSSSTATAPASNSKDKGKKEGNPALNMGLGALTAERQKHWPTTFDFAQRYLHLDELFLHNAPVEFENNDGELVKLAAGPTPGSMELFINSEKKGEVVELRYDAASGRITMQDDLPLATSPDSRSVIPLKERDRVVYLLSWLAQNCCVPGLPECKDEPVGYVLLILEKPVMCPLGSLLIGSKLDFDIHSPNCRMAFFGRILAPVDPKDLKSVRLQKMKSKSGFLDRVDKQEPTLLICRDMFTAETDMSLFTGLKVVHESSGLEGVLEGSYGKEGLFKVRFKEKLDVRTDAKGSVVGEERISLYFKKFDFDEKSRTINQ